MIMPTDDTELTAEDRLIAQLVDLSHKLPGGYHVVVGIRLEQTMKVAEELFTTYKLPKRAELIAELTLWRCHAGDGRKFLEQSERLLAEVIKHVQTSEPR